MNSNIHRRPLFEAVKKHATSGTFLTAIICNFISLGAGCLLCGTLLSILKILSGFIGLSAEDNFSSSLFDFYPIIILLAFAVSTAILLILTLKFISVRRFFLGKNNNPNGLEGIIKTQKAFYIFSICSTSIPVIMMILYTFSIVVSTETYAATIPMLFFIIPIYLAEIAGMIIFYHFSFKAIKSTVTYAINAANGIPEGKVSVFLIVISIIGIVTAAMLVLYSFIILFISLIFGGILQEIDDPFLSVTFSAVFGSFAIIFKALWPLLFVSVPTLISSICYVKLLFGFKKDMELAKKEHAQIQQQKVALEAENAVTAEESISE